MDETIQVLIADDHAIVREGLRLILEIAEGIAVAGEAADGAEAVELAEALRPDVILMDLRMPTMGGLAAIEEIRKRRLPAAIIILTTFNEDDLILSGLQAGAQSYLLKDTNRTMLINAIRAAARGDTLLPAEIVDRLLARAAQPAPPPPAEDAPTLTDRELEVLEAVARGERNKEIAYHLDITERTVKAHLTSVYNKLGVDSRAAAVAEATRYGLLVLGEQ